MFSFFLSTQHPIIVQTLGLFLVSSSVKKKKTILRYKQYCRLFDPLSYPPPCSPYGSDIRRFANSPGKGQLKCDGTRAETRFLLSAKRTSPFKSVGASVQSSTGSRGVWVSGSNAGYTVFRGRVKGTGYPLHLPVSSSLPLPCVTVCHHISTGVYFACSSSACLQCGTTPNNM